jgi:hypothetical protein
MQSAELKNDSALCTPHFALESGLSRMHLIHLAPGQINPENCPEPVLKAAMGVLPVLRNALRD